MYLLSLVKEIEAKGANSGENSTFMKNDIIAIGENTIIK